MLSDSDVRAYVKSLPNILLWVLMGLTFVLLCYLANTVQPAPPIGAIALFIVALYHLLTFVLFRLVIRKYRWELLTIDGVILISLWVYAEFIAG